MAEVIRMPRMSDTMEEGVIVGWLKKVGDEVEPGDVLAEVETDKATMELESYQDGVLLYIGIEEGAVPVNGILAVIGEAGEDYKPDLEAAQAKDSTGQSTSAQNGVAQTDTAPAQDNTPVAEVVTPVAAAPVASDQRIKASPLAKSIARDAGVNLAEITGTGDNGRVIKRDVENHLKAAPAPRVATPQVAMTSGDAYEDLPVSQMRKTIARRLGESKFSAPHFYLTIEMDMVAAIEARKRINEMAEVKISFNDIILKAVAAALQQHPAINSSWLGDRIRVNKNINIGVAVAVADGLLVPVIHNANHKTLSQINTEVKTLAGKAKEKKLQPNEMQGNTFTISNLGMFGIEEFTAIINPPDACILAVGGIIEKAVVKDGELAVGKQMKVTLSCDHRVVDGASGARFLNTLKAILEDPIRMLV